MMWGRETVAFGDGRVAHVALPEGYDDASNAYPLVVCLDAQWTFGTMCDASLNLGLARLIPRVVIVGLGWETTSSRETLALRAQAYTPTDAPFPDRVAPKGPNGPLRGGGAPAYLDWMVGEALPAIEARYRIQPGERLLMGHSLSALFGLYTLVNRPGVFNRYLLASPSIWWDGRAILDIEARSAAAGTKPAGNLFVSVGSGEEPPGFFPMITNARDMVGQLRSRNHPDLAFTMQVLDGEVHQSTIPAAISRGMRWLHAD